MYPDGISALGPTFYSIISLVCPATGVGTDPDQTLTDRPLSSMVFLLDTTYMYTVFHIALLITLRYSA